jgi:uncharacterized protein
MIEAIIYLVAIIMAETVTVFAHPVWGIAGYLVILSMLTVHAALGAQYPHRPLLLSLCLVPLVRVVSLSMPLTDVPRIWWYPVIYTPLLVATIIMKRILNYTREDVGLTLKRFWVQIAFGGAGLLFGGIEYLILKTEPLVVNLAWQQIWLPSLILLVCTGFVEELIFRGVLQHSAVRAFGWWGIIYVSMLFAVLHMGFYSWIDVAFVFVIALCFGWVVRKTGSIFGVSLSHGISNIILYLILPFF